MAIKFAFELRGLHDIEARLEAIKNGSEMQQIISRKLFKDALQIVSVSQRLCQVDTGSLRATGHARIPIFRGDRVDCVMGYGGPAAPYAVYVHEDLTKRHLNGTAKFLEIPFLEYQSGGLQEFATELRAASIFGRSQRAR